MGVKKCPDSGIYRYKFKRGGETYRKTCDTASRRRALAVEAEAKAEAEAKVGRVRAVGNDVPIALAILNFRKFMDEGRTKLGDGTINRYCNSYVTIADFLEQAARGVDVSDVDGKWMDSFIRWRQDQGVKNDTIKNDITAFSRCIAHHMGIKKGSKGKDQNPVLTFNEDLVETSDRREILIPEHDDIQKIVDTFGPMVARMIAFQTLTGMRQGEARNLKWSDIEFDQHRLRVTKSKTSTPRMVFLYEAVEDLLREMPRHPRSKHVFWHRRDGKGFTSISTAFGEHADDAGVPDIRNHDLRHRYAYMYLRRGGRLEALQRQMGHSTKQVTELYAHLQDDVVQYDLGVMGEAQFQDFLNAREELMKPFDFSKCGRDNHRKRHVGWDETGQVRQEYKSISMEEAEAS